MPSSSETLQNISLLVTFALIIAAKGFITTHPALSAILIFLFSLTYLVVSVVTRQAYFLYGTMLFGAVSYFFASNALGAPESSFPLLSVPLVVSLLLIANHLRYRLPEVYDAYPTTVIRAMNITVAVFTVWALVELSDLAQAPGFSKYIAGLSYLGFAGLYLAHLLLGGHVWYSYLFSIFLIAGSGLFGAALSSARFCWPWFLLAAAILVFVGTRYHHRKTLRWSKHLFYSFAISLCLALLFAFTHWSFVLLAAAGSSVLLWLGYKWLAEAVGRVRLATTDERLVSIYLLKATLIISLAVAPWLIVRPSGVDVDLPALALGFLFVAMAWARKEQRRQYRNEYPFFATLFLSGGLAGVSLGLPMGGSILLPLLVSLLIIVGLAFLLHAQSGRMLDSFRRSISESAVFPALFAWLIPVLLGRPDGALMNAVIMGCFVVIVGMISRQGLFLTALGIAVAGIVTAGTLHVLRESPAAWIIITGAGILAAAVFAWADRRDRTVLRQASHVAWLTLMIAGIAIAATVNAEAVLFCLTASAAGVVVISGLGQRSLKPDLFNRLMGVASVLLPLATVSYVALGRTDLLPAGECLLIIALSMLIAYGRTEATWNGRATLGLFAIGSLLTIFGGLPSAGAWLAAASIPLLILFLVASMRSERRTDLASSSLWFGHMLSTYMIGVALVPTSRTIEPSLVLATVPYILLYGLLPRLRGRFGFRFGVSIWLSLTAIFALAAVQGATYPSQITSICLLAIIWLGFGYVLHRRKNPTWALPIFITTTLLTAFCGLLTLVAPAAAVGAWQIFLICALIFISLFLLLRHTVYAYLVTLSLSLMAFEWVELSTTHFTQELMIYLVVAVGILTVMNLLGFLKRAAIRIASLPLFSIFTVQGTLLFSILGLALVGVVAAAYGVRATAHPKFCIACHNMSEFFDSWEHSSHKEVACLECHYEPGVQAHVEGKIGAVVQLAKFLTHSYTGGQPHGIVTNASCMRPGCHDQMDNSKETLLFKEQIRFRHDRHLGANPRGKDLNCVSCHGQMVQGKHISVTETTCLTCHFYGRGEDLVAIGNCQSCHLLPDKPVSFVGQSFNHQEFIVGNGSVRCVHCHSQVTEGDGSVSFVRCRACHLQGEIGAIEDQERLHAAHVSLGHFDCLQCHDEVKHGIHPMVHQLHLSSENCTTCHGGERHTIQERIYAGSVIAELEDMPDWMYAAGVTCDGCHTDEQFVRVGEMTLTSKASGAQECADCHGDPSYGDMLYEWQDETRTRLNELEVEIASLQKRTNRLVGEDERMAEIQHLLDSSSKILSIIVRDGSHGAHNYMYVSELLDSAEDDLAAAFRTAEK